MKPEKHMTERPSNKYSLSLMARLKHLVPLLPKNVKVLDVGCGEGLVSRLLIENGCDLTGIDYSEDAINKASMLNGDFVTTNIYLYDPKEKYDWIICSEVIEHLDYDKKALENMYKWLKSDGKLLLSVPTYLKLTERLRKIGGHRRHYRPDKLISMLESIGFEVEKKVEWGCLIRNIILSRFAGLSDGKSNVFLTLVGVLLRPLIILDTSLWPFKDSIILVLKKS